MVMIDEDAPGAEAPPLWRPRLRWRRFSFNLIRSIVMRPVPIGGLVAQEGGQSLAYKSKSIEREKRPADVLREGG